MERHVELLKDLPDRREPKPGELAQVCLEEEFEQ